MAGEPLVSIIIVVYNVREELESVLESVWPLKDDDIELIVIDGGSQDGTIRYLEAHASRIDFWRSESDRGIYDAMNKAITHATGTYLLHLNAGDRLLYLPKDKLRRGRTDSIDILAFRVALDGGRFFKPAYDLRLAITNTLHHQGTFFRRATFPGYDEDYCIFADFNTNQHLALAGASARVYQEIIAYHARDGVSNQKTTKAAAEFFKIIKNNHGPVAVPPAWVLCKWQGFLRRLQLGV